MAEQNGRTGIARALMGELRYRSSSKTLGGGETTAPKTAPRNGRAGGGGSRGFSPRANRLFALSQGSRAAVLKKISRGGTQNRQQLANQLDYLFSKSELTFGHMVPTDPRENGISPEKRAEIIDLWAADWEGKTKNGQTTHLLMSFPHDTDPGKALFVAELWAAEMFQSGKHQADEWSYVAGLHLDRAHPHVHMVVNNRGLVDGTWFYMAKDHEFNLDMMKTRMVEIAAEEGIALDCTSRVERGILTYGPSRKEIEAAHRENRQPFERMREGKALDAAKREIAASADTFRALSTLARLAQDNPLSELFNNAAKVLERGGIVQPFERDTSMESATVKTVGDLQDYFNNWTKQVGEQIDRQPAAERAALRQEFASIAADASRALGDEEGAELMLRPARTTMYRAKEQDQQLVTGDGVALSKEATADVKEQIRNRAAEVGLNAQTIETRLEKGATSAHEERDWIVKDVEDVAAKKSLSLAKEDEREQATSAVDKFYEATARIIQAAAQREREAERSAGNDRVIRTLDHMADRAEKAQDVKFENEEHANRFTNDLKERYGERIVKDLAEGRTDALEKDFPDPQKRLEIARGVVEAARNHETVGLTRAEADRARDRLTEIKAQEHTNERDRDDHGL